MVFKNLTNTLKETMEMTRKKPDDEEGGGIWDTIGRVAGPLLANMSQAQPQPPGMEQQPPALLPAPMQQPNPPAQPVIRRVAKPTPPEAAPAGAAPEAAPSRKKPPEAFTDRQRIENCLLLVRKMSLGLVQPAEHWRQIAFITRWLPPTMLEAVKAQDEQQIQSLGTEATLGNADILQWAADEEHQAFLRRCLADVRLFVLVEGKIDQLTAEQREGAIAEQRMLAEKRRRAVDAQAAASNLAQLRHENPNQEAPKPAPVEATVVTDASASIAPVEAKPAKIPPPDAGG